MTNGEKEKAERNKTFFPVILLVSLYEVHCYPLKITQHLKVYYAL